MASEETATDAENEAAESETLEDLALPEVAAEADKPFFFTAATSTPAKEEENTEAEASIESPVDSPPEIAETTSTSFLADSSIPAAAPRFPAGSQGLQTQNSESMTCAL